MKREWISVGVAIVALFGLPASAQVRTDFSKLQVKTTDLGNGVYLLGWQGGDSLVLIGDDAVVLVDTSVAPMADKIKAAIAHLSSKPIKFIVTTHAHADHIGGNESLAQGGAVIVAHDTARARMVTGQKIPAFSQFPPQPPGALPAVTYSEAMTLHVAGETIELIHAPRAHTDNDSLLFFRRANVIHTSGTFGNDQTYTFFDIASGGSLDGTIAAQEKILSLANDRTRIIADEGEPATKAALQASHDVLVVVRARVQKLIEAGKSEDETVAARPLQDLDATWVHSGGFLTGDVFTRMAYQSLKGRAPARAR